MMQNLVYQLIKEFENPVLYHFKSLKNPSTLNDPKLICLIMEIVINLII